jgi:filamentous hemagglutinin
VLFGRDANINVGALVASALDISNDVFERGLTSLVARDESTSPEAAFAWRGDATKFRNTMVKVEEGAKLRTTSGGRVLLLAPKVDNAGRIETPEGQTILAAGAKVYLTAPLDSSLRGFLVEVDPYSGSDAPSLIGGSVVNRAAAKTTETKTVDGKSVEIERVYQIVAKRGNVTLAGFDVAQEGRILVTSTVDQNGSITLKARDTWTRNRQVDVPNSEPVFVPVTGRTGNLALGAASETSVLPEAAAARARPGDFLTDATGNEIDATGKVWALRISTEIDLLPTKDNARTITDDQTFNRSRIDLSGKSITVGSGARVIAPSGVISFLAEGARAVAEDLPFQLRGVADNGGIRISVGANARIDASGLGGVVLSGGRDVLEVDLRGPELKDAPLQRQGILRNASVNLDLRTDPALVDLAPFRAQVQRGIAERSATGGDIVLKSEGDVVIGGGAKLDVSGGWINWSAATIGVTRVVSNGHTVDLADAPTDLVYSDMFTEQRAQAGYTDGRDAGTVQLWATRIASAGTFAGAARVGERQQSIADAPLGGRLLIGDPSSAAGSTFSTLVFDAGTTALSGLTDGAAPDTLHLDAGLFGRHNFTRLAAYTSESVTLRSGLTVDVGPGGSFITHGGATTIGGRVIAPGGYIEIVAAGDLVVTSGARLDAAGLWTNEQLAKLRRQPVAGAVALDGGDVTVRGANVTLASGSSIDVSAGAAFGADGRFRYGDAGSISIATRVPAANEIAGATPYRLVLDATLSGYGFGAFRGSSGGSLAVKTSDILVGGTGALADGQWRASDAFFGHGFSSFALTGIDALTVAPGATVRPEPFARMQPTSAQWIASGALPGGIAALSTPADLRDAVRIELSAVRAEQGFGVVTVGRDAIVDAGIGGHIGIDAENVIGVDGTLSAAAGSIALALPRPRSDDLYDPVRKIFLGDDAQLLARGAVVLDSRALQKPSGDVLAGGTISLTAGNGYIAVARGADLDVSGTSGRVLVAQQRGSAVLRGLADVNSDGGSIRISASEGFSIDGDLHAHAGGAGAVGGSLDATIDLANRRFADQSDPVLQDLLYGPRTLALTATESGAPVFADANAPVDRSLLATGRIPVARVVAGGFGSLAFSSEHRIDFQGDMTLRADQRLSFDAPNLMTSSGADVVLESAYVNLGSLAQIRQAAGSRDAVTGGNGSLVVNARFVDLSGRVATQGFGAITVTAAEDIRLRGAPIPGTTADGLPSMALRRRTRHGSRRHADSAAGHARDTRRLHVRPARPARRDVPGGRWRRCRTGAVGRRRAARPRDAHRHRGQPRRAVRHHRPRCRRHARRACRRAAVGGRNRPADPVRPHDTERAAVRLFGRRCRHADRSSARETDHRRCTRRESRVVGAARSVRRRRSLRLGIHRRHRRLARRARGGKLGGDVRDPAGLHIVVRAVRRAEPGRRDARARRRGASRDRHRVARSRGR